MSGCTASRPSSLRRRPLRLTSAQDLGRVRPSPPAPNHIRQARFIPPILRVKLRGDVIFHLGSVIILAVSGALPRLGGRSEPGGSVPARPLPTALHPPTLAPLRRLRASAP